MRTFPNLLSFFPLWTTIARCSMHVQNRLKSSWVASVLFRYALWLFQKKYSLRLNQTVVVQVPFCSTSTSILEFALSSLWFLSVFWFPSSAVVLTQPVNDGLPPPLKPRCVVCWTCKPAVVIGFHLKPRLPITPSADADGKWYWNPCFYKTPS